MLAQADAVAEGLLEAAAAAGDQVIAGILHPGGVGADERQGRARHLQLAPRRAAREVLDRLAIAIAGDEIHGAELALRAEDAIDEAHALEELPPVVVRHHAEAGDDVPHRHVGRAVALMLGSHEVVRGGAGAREPRPEPGQGGRGGGVLIAEALGQLHGEGRREHLVAHALEGARGRWAARPARAGCRRADPPPSAPRAPPRSPRRAGAGSPAG